MIGFLWQHPRDGAGQSTLRSGRIYLRPPVAADYEDWAALRQESRDFLVPWEPAWTEDGLSRAAYRRRMKRYALERRTGSGCAFLIFRREDDALLGGINVSNIRRGAAQTGNVGYWIGAPHARRGYMTEALEAVVALGFGELALHRMEAACLAENRASIALLRKAGFRQEGAARKYLCINGEWRDHLIFALLREDRRAGV